MKSSFSRTLFLGRMLVLLCWVTKGASTTFGSRTKVDPMQQQRSLERQLHLTTQKLATLRPKYQSLQRRLRWVEQQQQQQRDDDLRGDQDEWAAERDELLEQHQCELDEQRRSLERQYAQSAQQRLDEAVQRAVDETLARQGEQLEELERVEQRAKAHQQDALVKTQESYWKEQLQRERARSQKWKRRALRKGARKTMTTRDNKEETTNGGVLECPMDEIDDPEHFIATTVEQSPTPTRKKKKKRRKVVKKSSTRRQKFRTVSE